MEDILHFVSNKFNPIVSSLYSCHSLSLWLLAFPLSGGIDNSTSAITYSNSQFKTLIHGFIEEKKCTELPRKSSLFCLSGTGVHQLRGHSSRIPQNNGLCFNLSLSLLGHCLLMNMMANLKKEKEVIHLICRIN